MEHKEGNDSFTTQEKLSMMEVQDKVMNKEGTAIVNVVDAPTLLGKRG